MSTVTLDWQRDFDKLEIPPSSMGPNIGSWAWDPSPAPGSYWILDNTLTISHQDQTAGILLPLLRFYLITENLPEVMPPSERKALLSVLYLTASSYEYFIEDNEIDGLSLRIPTTIPTANRGLEVPNNYLYAECSMRLLLYKATGDSRQLELAKGMLRTAIQSRHVNQSGFLVVEYWPRRQSRKGIWDRPANVLWEIMDIPSVGEDIPHLGFLTELLYLIHRLASKTTSACPRPSCLPSCRPFEPMPGAPSREPIPS